MFSEKVTDMTRRNKNASSSGVLVVCHCRELCPNNTQWLTTAVMQLTKFKTQISRASTLHTHTHTLHTCTAHKLFDKCDIPLQPKLDPWPLKFIHSNNGITYPVITFHNIHNLQPRKMQKWHEAQSVKTLTLTQV